MKLNDYFKKFVGNISLGATRLNRIDSAVANWESKLKDDEELSDIFEDYFPQGSYSTNTGIKPKKGKEFDVDVVLVLDINEQSDRGDVINLVKDCIKSHEQFKDRVTAKDRCVRIEYANDFHVDVVPAMFYEEILKIPSKKEDEWVKTNPQGFTDWCTGINSYTENYFIKTVKILKYWRDENVGEDTAPKSILLTTLLGNAFEEMPSLAETIIETLKNMISDIEGYLLFLTNDDDVPVISNPSLSEENLARNWNKLKAERFNRKLNKLKSDCEDAIDEKNKDKSVEKWQDIFGSNFPSDLGEVASMAKSIDRGEVKVDETGSLNKLTGTKIKDHRFYGEEYL
ncbi:cyclic GMP-AMP synthase DncV-like nucleotidyltransferase [Virgibacillus oceani]